MLRLVAAPCPWLEMLPHRTAVELGLSRLETPEFETCIAIIFNNLQWIKLKSFGCPMCPTLDSVQSAASTASYKMLCFE
jgi:hypothetical protein